MKKSMSSSGLSSQQADVNMNVSWMNGPFVWPAYFMGLVAARVLLAFVPAKLLAPESQWTVLFVVHALVRGIWRVGGWRSPVVAYRGLPWPAVAYRGLPHNNIARSNPPTPQATFWLLHWNRGSPVWEDQGEHIDQTVWEQIDNGVPWTPTRKFFIIVPILLYVRRRAGRAGAARWRRAC